MNALSRLNRTGVFLATLALMLGGLLLPGAVGGLLLLALAGGLVALLVATWPHRDPRTRLMRLAVLALLVVLAAVKLG